MTSISCTKPQKLPSNKERVSARCCKKIPLSAEKGENLFSNNERIKPNACRRFIHKPLYANLKKTASCRGPLAARTSVNNPNLQCKRSFSLDDLTPSKKGCIAQSAATGSQCDLRESMPTSCGEMDALSATPSSTKPRTKAAYRGCQAFVLNAWRKRRVELNRYRLVAQQLSSQVNNLNMQITVLRDLLSSENARISAFSADTNATKSQLATKIKENENLKQENEMHTEELSRLNEQLSDLGTECENLKNSLQGARAEVSALDMQIDREREKLSEARSEISLLNNKVETLEDSATKKQQLIEKLKTRQQETEIGLNVKITELSMAQMESDNALSELQRLQVERELIQQQLESQAKVIRDLKDKVRITEEHMLSREKLNKDLELLCQNQISEIYELERRLQELEGSSWYSKIGRISRSFFAIQFILMHAILPFQL